MDFTLNELKEIEKRFDIVSGVIVKAHAETVTLLSRGISNDKTEAYQLKLLDEHVKAFDVYRTISAKCSAMIESMVKD